MTEGPCYMAVFKDISPASQALDRLRGLGIAEEDINIVSGVPYTAEILGRPKVHTHIPTFAFIGFFVGLIGSVLLNYGTPLLYPVYVGGMPLLSTPTGLVIIFEISMLGMLLFVFLGVFWDTALPSFRPKEYDPTISDGHAAILFTCPQAMVDQMQETMKELGALSVKETEAVAL